MNWYIIKTLNKEIEIIGNTFLILSTGELLLSIISRKSQLPIKSNIDLFSFLQTFFWLMNIRRMLIFFI